MRLIIAFLSFLKKYLNITEQENAYQYLMLVVSLIITSIGTIGFSIKIYFEGSFRLSGVLMAWAVLNFLNLFLLKKYSNYIFSSFLFISCLFLSMVYLVFDSGHSGLGFLWFYAIPAVNLFVLGLKKGTIISLLFLGFLLLIFMLPEYLIDPSFTSDVKSRLLISYFALVTILFLREWIFELLKKQAKSKDEVFEINIEHNRNAVLKLTNQIRLITNDILSSTSVIKKNNPSINQVQPIESIYDSSLNLLNIINSIGEYSDFKNVQKYDNEYYDIRKTVENTLNLFNSYKTEIVLNIDKNLPVLFFGNPLFLKQILFNVLENYIQDELNISHKIYIDISKGEYSKEQLEVKYSIVKVLSESFNFKLEKSKCELDSSTLNVDNSEDVDRLGLKNVLPIIDKLNGEIHYKNTTQFLSICFNQKVLKDSHYKPETIAEHSYTHSSLSNQNIENISKKKLSKMNVLLIEDNPITQKAILFSLNKVVKKLDITENGIDGLEMIYKNRYDLILLDMNMPLMDGYAVATKIRALEQGTNLHIPIIAVISDYLERDLNQILEAGVDDHISKPFKTADLIKKINVFILEEKL